MFKNLFKSQHLVNFYFVSHFFNKTFFDKGNFYFEGQKGCYLLNKSAGRVQRPSETAEDPKLKNSSSISDDQIINSFSQVS